MDSPVLFERQIDTNYIDVDIVDASYTGRGFRK
jgi:hypothetical protein